MAKSKKYGGFTPNEIQDQIVALFPGQTDQWISRFFKFLIAKAPFIISLFMAQKPGDKMATAPGQGDGDEELARQIEQAVCNALDGKSVEPGKVGGPGLEMVLTTVFESLLDMARRNVPLAVKTISGILDRYSPIALP